MTLTLTMTCQCQNLLLPMVSAVLQHIDLPLCIHSPKFFLHIDVLWVSHSILGKPGGCTPSRHYLFASVCKLQLAHNLANHWERNILSDHLHNLLDKLLDRHFRLCQLLLVHTCQVVGRACRQNHRGISFQSLHNLDYRLWGKPSHKYPL